MKTGSVSFITNHMHFMCLYSYSCFFLLIRGACTWEKSPTGTDKVMARFYIQLEQHFPDCKFVVEVRNEINGSNYLVTFNADLYKTAMQKKVVTLNLTISLIISKSPPAQ